ncbi:MAG: hypothetical protein WCL21_13880 [Mariniphaga sp.]
MSTQTNNRKERCNILIFGTMSSGSSAMHNLLKEYDNIGHFSNEFDDFRAPGLVADQLSEASSINFPNRINKITGNSSFIKRLIFQSTFWNYLYDCIPKRYLEIDYQNNLLRKFKNKLISLNRSHLLRDLNKKLETNISFDEKIKFAGQWIQNIGNDFSLDKDYTLFDQPLLTSTDMSIWKTVFNPYKLIIVYRNPKDQIADIIKRRTLFTPYGPPYMTMAGDNLEAIYGKDKKGAIKFQIDAIQCRLKWIDYLETVLDRDHLLVMDFEGLVTKYDEYKLRVENFIGGIKDHHACKNKYFDPIRSKENIDIYRKYLDEDDLTDLSGLESWYEKRLEKEKMELERIK